MPLAVLDFTAVIVCLQDYISLSPPWVSTTFKVNVIRIGEVAVAEVPRDAPLEGSRRYLPNFTLVLSFYPILSSSRLRRKPALIMFTLPGNVEMNGRYSATLLAMRELRRRCLHHHCPTLAANAPGTPFGENCDCRDLSPCAAGTEHSSKLVLRVYYI